MLDRNELWAEAFELGEMIAQSEEVTSYQEAEKAMRDNIEAQVLLRKLRDQQEQLTALERFATRDHLKGLESDIQALLDLLDGIPEVQKFRECQSAVNELLQSVSSILAKVVTESIENCGTAEEEEGA